MILLGKKKKIHKKVPIHPGEDDTLLLVNTTSSGSFAFLCLRQGILLLASAEGNARDDKRLLWQRSGFL